VPPWIRSRSRRTPTQPKLEQTSWPASAAAQGVPVVVAALIAAFIAVFTNVQSQRATNTQLRIAEQGQITDRYNAAITNLGSRSIEVRLGGIYALQRLMQDSSRDQPTVVAVLGAFVRDQTLLAGRHQGAELPAADRHSSCPDRGRHAQHGERRPADGRRFRSRTTCPRSAL
jgi:hypothetical protein